MKLRDFMRRKHGAPKARSFFFPLLLFACPPKALYMYSKVFFFFFVFFGSIASSCSAFVLDVAGMWGFF